MNEKNEQIYLFIYFNFSFILQSLNLEYIFEFFLKTMIILFKTS